MTGKLDTDKYAAHIIIIFIVALLVLAGYAFFFPHQQAAKISPADELPAGLPKLVDLGRDTCESCKAMRPILEELQDEYEGRVGIAIINIDDYPQEVENYRVYLIPTQIFINADGTLFYRHEGFMPKEDIKDVFRRMGIN